MRKARPEDMYNESVKSEWIDDYLKTHKGDSLRGVLISFMIRFAPHERERRADLCTWTDMDDIQSVLTNVLSHESVTRKKQVSILKDYVTWCCDRSIPGAADVINDIEYNDVDVSGAIRERLVSSPKQLDSYLTMVFGTEIRPNDDSIRRCFAWLAYIGIPIGEATLVKRSDVHFDDMEIVYNENTYKIYYEALKTLRVVANADSMERIRGSYTDVVPRAPGNLLLRGISVATSPEVRYQHLSRKLSMREMEAIKAGKTDKNMSYTDIYRSGIFYRMYEDEIAGFPVDFTILPGLFGLRTTKRNHILFKIRKYKEDYEAWKRVYR